MMIEVPEAALKNITLWVERCDDPDKCGSAKWEAAKARAKDLLFLEAIRTFRAERREVSS